MNEKTFLIDNTIITNYYIAESFVVFGLNLSPTVGNFKKILKLYNMELMEFEELKKKEQKRLIKE
jgi:hypothetical protein